MNTRAGGTSRSCRELKLPSAARERVVARFSSGAKSRSQLHHDKKLIAEVLWEDDGIPAWGWRLKNGEKHGPSVEYWHNGQVAFIEPYVAGRVHGVTRHFDEQGRLLLESRYVRGSGVDLWCDLHNRTLSEETWSREGRLHGVRRNWNSDGETVWLEEHWENGELHGVVREWNDKGRLRRGFPRYYLHGRKVPRRGYPFAVPKSDDLPRRALPILLVGQPVHREMWARRKHECDWSFGKVRTLEAAVLHLKKLLVRDGWAEVEPLVTLEVVRAAVSRSRRAAFRRIAKGAWPRGARFFACHTLRERGVETPCFLLRLEADGYALPMVDEVWDGRHGRDSGSC